jgi:hypothetical protein
MSQKAGVPPAIPEHRAGEDPIDLIANRFAIDAIQVALADPLVFDPTENWLCQSRSCHEEPPF